MEAHNLPQITTLISDIEEVLLNGIEGKVTDEEVQEFGQQLAQTVKKALTREERKPTLRMSNIGRPCERQLWYDMHGYKGEELRAEHYMKFFFGHLLEDVLIFLAKAAGHSVEGQQDESEIQGIKGHRDVVIDGHLVDVKSASSPSFKKFKDGSLKDNDGFGYVDQLQSYLYASRDDEKVVDKDSASFLVVDKTLGHIHLDTHPKNDINYDALYAYKKSVINSDELPHRAFEDEPEGKSGNRKLGKNCSYCPHKFECFPGVKQYNYARGPVYLTKIVREPNVSGEA